MEYSLEFSNLGILDEGDIFSPTRRHAFLYSGKTKGVNMHKLLIGLLAFGSLPAFASVGCDVAATKDNLNSAIKEAKAAKNTKEFDNVNVLLCAAIKSCETKARTIEWHLDYACDQKPVVAEISPDRLPELSKHLVKISKKALKSLDKTQCYLRARTDHYSTSDEKEGLTQVECSQAGKKLGKEYSFDGEVKLTIKFVDKDGTLTDLSN